jgi:WS/DGAT/MGAT family acyltransferase
VKRPSVLVPRRLSAIDAGLLDLERPHAPLHLGALAIFEGRLCPQRLARRIESRLWRLGNLGRALMPVPFALARPAFEDPLRFDPRDHIHPWALPSPGGEAELLDACARVLAAPLNRERPLFELHLFEGLDRECSAVVLKVHCAVARSAAGDALFAALLDPVADSPRDLATRRSKKLLPGPVTRLARAFSDNALRGLGDASRALSVATDPRTARDQLRRLRAAAGELFELANDPAPGLPWNAEVGRRRRLGLTRLPLADAERIAAHHRCGVNEVVLSALGGAINGYLRSGGIPLLRAEARVIVPAFSQDRDSSRGGQTLSAAVVPVNIGIGDEGVRLDAVVRAARECEARGSYSASTTLLELADRLPPFVSRALARGLRLERFANVIAAGGDGPREARWLCGQRLLAVHPFLPIVDGIGLSFATYAYAGGLFVGINADADLVPDLDKLRLELEQSFAALSRAS